MRLLKLAADLKCSPKQVIRLFADEEGVIDIGTKDNRILRIPESAVNRVLARRRVA